jgi:hypothetical protein
MMVWMSMEWIESVDVIGYGFCPQVGRIKADFCNTQTTNLTQHDSHGPNAHPKTID